MTVDHLGLVEEGDEGLVRRLDEHELERVTVESDALKGGDHGLQHCATRNYKRTLVGSYAERDMLPTVADTGHLRVGEDGVLTEVSPATSLFDERGWQAVRKGPVVNELAGHVVPEL